MSAPKSIGRGGATLFEPQIQLRFLFSVYCMTALSSGVRAFDRLGGGAPRVRSPAGMMPHRTTVRKAGNEAPGPKWQNQGRVHL